MNQTPRNHNRADMQRSIERDLKRRARREADGVTFWRSLSVLGMVGWPIALTSVGGVLLGRFVDERFNTGVRFTLMLLTAGALLGSYTAWCALNGRKK